jgi:hypothetical protein
LAVELGRIAQQSCDPCRQRACERGSAVQLKGLRIRQHMGSVFGTVFFTRKSSTALFTQEFDLLYAVCPSP